MQPTATRLLWLSLSFATCLTAQEITGERKLWHDIVLTFDGPETSESAEPNPFLTFRLPFRLFDLVAHLGGGDTLVLRTVGKNAAGDRVEGFQDFGHAIRAL